MFTSDCHVHTTYCDGASTPSQIALAALDLGIQTLGFSGHGRTAFDLSYCMSEAGETGYVRELQKLSAQYKDRLEILIGIERDYYGEEPGYDYDFVIGSVHYIKTEAGFLPVDESAAMLDGIAADFFGGDWDSLAEEYFRTVAQVADKTECDIVGHFDLITKFNERAPRFDEIGKRYLDAAVGAVKELCRRDVVFEVNTGAISRGYRTAPYPSPAILRAIRENGGRVILSSDSHSADTLCAYFDRAAAACAAAGFTSRVELTADGMREVGL